MSRLKSQLRALRSDIAHAAQEIIDEWQQDEEGLDEEFGAGGICDRVSEAMGTIIGRLPGIEIAEGGQPGDDHAYLIVYDPKEAFIVDIPPDVYETGGGYNWKKKKKVHVSPDDVVIEEIKLGPNEKEALAKGW
jgi:hypothetical protein